MNLVPKKGEPRTRRKGRELVKECETYLCGRYADHMDAEHRVVPNWAWINVLAHGDLERLREVAAGDGLDPRRRTSTTVWWQAVAFVADVVLAQGGDESSLDELQRSVLVPLELAWLAAGLRRTPSQLVRVVLDALDQAPKPSTDDVDTGGYRHERG